MLYVPATAMAVEMGNPRISNMILMGAWTVATGVVTTEALAQALADHLPPHRQNLVWINQQALLRGAALAREQLEGVAA